MYFKLTTSRIVTDQITGDYYEDWKKTIGYRHELKDAIGHKIIMAIRNKKTLFSYLDEDDYFEGELFDFIKPEFKDYLAASVFVALAEKTIEAFYNLDVLNDINAFTNALNELSLIVREMLSKLKSGNFNITFNAIGDPETRKLTLELIVSAITFGWGNELWGEFPWGSIAMPPITSEWGNAPWGLFAWEALG